MTKQNRVLHEKIDKLLEYIPYFESLDVSSLAWVEMKKEKDGNLRLMPPPYPEEIIEFFLLAGSPEMAEYEYDPKECSKRIKDDRYIQAASLDKLKGLLTYCVRGERFGDGFWLEVIEGGIVLKLLKRLKEIRGRYKEHIKNAREARNEKA